MFVKTGKNVEGTAPDQYLSASPEQMHKLASLLIQKYRSPVTPIREVIINGLETTDNAVRDGAEFRPVELSINATYKDMDDSQISPFGVVDEESYIDGGVIVITDHGEGMSEEFMTTHFINLTYSTKDQDAHAIGGFGIGSKSILSISDYATWRTVKDGRATVLVMSQDSRGVAINHESMDASGESNGTTVTIPVNESVMKYIIGNVSKEFLNYVAADRVVVNGNVTGSGITVGAVVDHVIHTASNGVDFLPYKDITQNNRYRSNYGEEKNKIHLMVDGAPYPVPEEFRKGSEFLNGEKRQWREIFYHSTHKRRVNVGDVVVNLSSSHPDVNILPSRESLMDSGELNDLITEKIDTAMTETISEMRDLTRSSTTVKEWIDNLDFFLDSQRFQIYDAINSWSGYDPASCAYAQFTMEALTGRPYHANTTKYNDEQPPMAFYSVDSEDYVQIGSADFSAGAYLYGDADVSVRRESRVEGHPRWKKIINDRLALTNGDAMENVLLNAATIDDVITSEKVRFLTNSDHTQKNDIIRFKNITEMMPEWITLDDIYTHFGVTKTVKSAEDIRNDILTKVRVAGRKGKKKGQTKKIDKPIIIHQYQKGQGFVEVAAPATVPALEKWITENHKDYSGKVLHVNEVDGTTNEVSDLFLSATAQEADDMIASSEIDAMMIIRSIKDSVDNPYHTRVWKKINELLSVFNRSFFPVSYHTSNRYYRFHGNPYSPYSQMSDVRDTAANYFSRENVQRRLSLADLANDNGMDIDDMINFVNKLRDLSMMNDKGVSALDILNDTFTMTQKAKSVIETVPEEFDNEASTDGDTIGYGDLLYDLSRIDLEGIIIEHEVADTMFRKMRDRDLYQFLRVDDLGLSVVLPEFAGMIRRLHDQSDEKNGEDGLRLAI